MRSLNELKFIRNILLRMRRLWLVSVVGAEVSSSASISLSARIVAGHKGGVAIGDYTLVAFKTLLLAQHPNGSVAPIRIGNRCFIGGGSSIMPGVTIGDCCIIAAGATVTTDVEYGTIVAGCPARVIRNIGEIGNFGRLPEADDNVEKYYRF